MKAFWIDAGYHKYVEEYIDEWARYEIGWFGGIVYAESPAQAKHLFIKENNEHLRNPEFEYTDKMSIRVLATATNEEWKPGFEGHDDFYEYSESPWMRGKRSKYGEERYQEFKQSQLEFEATQVSN